MSSLYILDIDPLWKWHESHSVVSRLFVTPMACIPLRSSVMEFSRLVEWVAIPFSRESSWPRDQTQVSLTAARFFTFWATRESLMRYMIYKIFSHSGLCLFTLLGVSFAVQKLCSLMLSQLFNLVFVTFVSGVTQKNHHLKRVSRTLCLRFLLGVLWFRVLHSNLRFILS